MIKLLSTLLFFGSVRFLFGLENELDLEKPTFEMISKNSVSKNSLSGIVYALLRIASEQPDSVEAWLNNRIYLKPSRIRITHQGAFICFEESFVQIPSFASDEKGIFILCSKEDAQNEAKEHFDRAGQALLHALGHSAAAGATIEFPPVSIFEGYQAVESWKEMAQEYNAGCEAERRAETEK